MAKIGVGVGEDFPIEDKPEHEAGAGPERNSGNHRRDSGHDCGWGCGPDDYEAWRAWRNEWRSRRREWRRREREARRMEYGPGHPPYYYWGLPKILRIVVMIAAIMLIFRIVAAVPLVLLGLAVLGGLYIAHRHHEDGRYRHDMPPPPSGGR